MALGIDRRMASKAACGGAMQFCKQYIYIYIYIYAMYNVVNIIYMTCMLMLVGDG